MINQVFCAAIEQSITVLGMFLFPKIIISTGAREIISGLYIQISLSKGIIAQLEEKKKKVVDETQEKIERLKGLGT